MKLFRWIYILELIFFIYYIVIGDIPSTWTMPGSPPITQ